MYCGVDSRGAEQLRVEGVREAPGMQHWHCGTGSGKIKKKLSIRSASGRMRRDTLLSPSGLALPPFSLPPFPVPPGA
eukprot:scaffold4771_cov129-Isochrysis_galbana.AAC.12